MHFPRHILENRTNRLLEAQSCERCFAVDRAFLQNCKGVVTPFGCSMSFQARCPSRRGYSNGQSEGNFPCSSFACKKFQNCDVWLGYVQSLGQHMHKFVQEASEMRQIDTLVWMWGHSTLQCRKRTRYVHICVVQICHHGNAFESSLPTEVQQVSGNAVDPSFTIHSYIKQIGTCSSLRLNCLKKFAKTVSKQLNHHTSSQQRDGRGEQPQIQICGKGCTVRLNACIGNCFVLTNQKQFSYRLQNHACEQRYVIPGSHNGCIQMTFTTCEFASRHNGPTPTACFKSAPSPRN